MNPEDNIKNFFQRRLKDVDPQAADWNTPSDDIWNKAKVDFPKENKSRKALFFWCFGIVALITVSALLYTQIDNIDTPKIAQTNSSLYENEAQEITKIKSAKLNEPAAQDESLSISSLSNQTVENNTNLSDIKQQTSSLLNSKTNVNQSTTPNLKITNIATRKTGSKNLIDDNNSFTNTTQGENEVNTNQERLTGGKLQNLTILDQESRNQNTVNSNSKISVQATENKTALLNIERIVSTSPGLLSYDPEDIFMDDHIVSVFQQNKKWEFGLSTSPILLPLERLINADTTNSEIRNLNLKYISLNLPVTRILNEKWSLSSGLYYKRGSISAQILSDETLDFSNSDDVSVMFNEDASLARISLQDETQEIDINFKLDSEIRDGDLVTLNGRSKLDFNIIQLPLLANYHIRKNRFEYIFSLGGSLDFINLELSEFELLLSKENRVITEPINFRPMSENVIEYSIYGGLGVKYHFNNTMNLSYGIRTDITGIIFTTHELGIHYRI